MSRQQTSPHMVRRQLLKNTHLNIESVGKQDITTLSDVIDAQEGGGTVIRLIMGATRAMPLRALSYVDTAMRIAQTLPCEQLQIVHANTLGGQINGINTEASFHDAQQLAALARMHAMAFFPALVPKLLHAEDKPIDLHDFVPAAERVFEADTAISANLGRKGTKHGGDALVYAAAHSAFQDTDRLQLQPLLADMPAQTAAERIVSVGCQQERVFYLTRMAMREHLTVDLVDTAQLFTRHHTPPYFMARGGEQLLSDALANGVDMQQCYDTTARRDLNQFIASVQGVHHG
jgi:hypothetical protein